MTGPIFTYIGSFLIFSWGVAHLFPTMNVVRGFGKISEDNKRVLIMEWISEGFALIFIGLLVACVTIIDRSSLVSKTVCWLSFGALNCLSLVSLFTAYQNAFFVYKLCPYLFTGSSLLILIGCYLN